MNLRDIAREAWTEESFESEDTDECWQACVEAVLKVVSKAVDHYSGELVASIIRDMSDPSKDQYER